MVRGYHEYRGVWAASIGEELPCRRERGNAHDSFAVAVKKDGRVVGHIPTRISSTIEGLRHCQLKIVEHNEKWLAEH